MWLWLRTVPTPASQYLAHVAWFRWQRQRRPRRNHSRGMFSPRSPASYVLQMGKRAVFPLFELSEFLIKTIPSQNSALCRKKSMYVRPLPASVLLNLILDWNHLKINYCWGGQHKTNKKQRRSSHPIQNQNAVLGAEGTGRHRNTSTVCSTVISQGVAVV